MHCCTRQQCCTWPEGIGCLRAALCASNLSHLDSASSGCASCVLLHSTDLCPPPTSRGPTAMCGKLSRAHRRSGCGWVVDHMTRYQGCLLVCLHAVCLLCAADNCGVVYIYSHLLACIDTALQCAAKPCEPRRAEHERESAGARVWAELSGSSQARACVYRVRMYRACVSVCTKRAQRTCPAHTVDLALSLSLEITCCETNSEQCQQLS
jgi:hypothetical protein